MGHLLQLLTLADKREHPAYASEVNLEVDSARLLSPCGENCQEKTSAKGCTGMNLPQRRRGMTIFARGTRDNSVQCAC
jgi:hypothetical protein